MSTLKVYGGPINPAKEGPQWTPFIVTLSHNKLAQGVIAHSAR